MKKFYGAPSLKACQSAFDAFQKRWSHYSGAVNLIFLMWKNFMITAAQCVKLCTQQMPLKVSIPALEK